MISTFARPQFLGSGDIPGSLKAKLAVVKAEIEKKDLHLGIEHSQYVNEGLQRTLSLENFRDEDVLSIFLDKERLTGKMPFMDYLQNPEEQGHVPGFHIDRSLISDERVFDVRCFVGKTGYSSSLHFDWNSSSIMLVNIVGHKTFRLYSPLRSHELQGYSNFFLGEAPTPDFVFDIKEGEGLVIPPFWWHQAIYQSTSCSVSVRYGNDDILFWMKHVYPSWKTVLKFHDQVQALHHFARKLFLVTDVNEKYELIERKVGMSGVMNHPKYESWSKGYLTYMLQENKNRNIPRG